MVTSPLGLLGPHHPFRSSNLYIVPVSTFSAALLLHIFPFFPGFIHPPFERV